ncbi:alpha/beta hydrolase [Pseudomonas sp. JV241A]|uniref:alpha/beta fold hydrolase n=1 Tax=Pseudomonas sp. JV241A TaxID=2078785 RepID=UPI00100D1C1F|nr:alpha/beta hydrolase [Pseudomonas sp. JV241A]SPO66854.1 Alpha/beta hydrolase fold protein [Pseudomonas sp. JV241A]
MTPHPRFARIGRITLAYETLGPEHAPPVLLVHGLAQQLTAWPDALVHSLVKAGFRVIRFDNRDIGKSSRMCGTPHLAWHYLNAQVGRRSRAPYSLDDMAHDTLGLIDSLKLGPVHLVGASMGGMIAQIVAARFPYAVRSLTSIMSSSGDRRLPNARADVRKLLLNPVRQTSLQREIDHNLQLWELIASPGYPTPREQLRARLEDDLRRNAPAAGGIERQFAAILASGSRVPLLSQIDTPTLVLHGLEDPLIPFEAGRSTAEHIPDAVFESIAGMGHDLPAALLPTLAERLLKHFRQAVRAQLPPLQSRQCAKPLTYNKTN